MQMDSAAPAVATGATAALPKPIASEAGQPGSVAIVLPILNAGRFAAPLIAAILAQTRQPDQVVVIDSASEDDAPARFAAAGYSLHRIQRVSFDHGATRNLGLALAASAEFVVFLTQDALPADALALERLMQPFADPSVAIVCGRQLARPEARAIERHARDFNYPTESRTRCLANARGLGVKAAFNSNSFAAYRRTALDAIGGFPERVIVGEDQVAAGRALLAGWSVAYAAGAKVVHSHDYTLMQEFRRYFDLGIFHHCHPFLLDAFGAAEAEGLRFIRSELGYLLPREPHRIPEALLRSAAKLIAYRLGRSEAALPAALKRMLAMHGNHFARPAPNSSDEIAT